MRRKRLAVPGILVVAAFTSPVGAQVIDSVDTVGPWLDLCVTRQLAGQGFSPPRDTTFRLAFRRDGTIMGSPFVTYSRPLRSEPEQQRFIGVMTDAIRSCAPLPFSTGLGAAIAGKIFTFRYTLKRAKDQSI
jgi:hypothetical protein